MTPKGAKVKQVQDDAMSGIEGQMVYAQRQQTRRDPSRGYFAHYRATMAMAGYARWLLRCNQIGSFKREDVSSSEDG